MCGGVTVRMEIGLWVTPKTMFVFLEMILTDAMCSHTR